MEVVSQRFELRGSGLPSAAQTFGDLSPELPQFKIQSSDPLDLGKLLADRLGRGRVPAQIADILSSVGRHPKPQLEERSPPALIAADETLPP
jgi:hypothetical protein